MSAVHAVSLPGEAFQPLQDRCIVAFRGRSRAPGQRGGNLPAAAASDHHGSHAGARQGIFEALHGSQRPSERRVRLAQQVTAAVDLHHVDSHAAAFAEFVEAFALGVDVVQRPGVALLGPQRIDVVAGGLQVVGRVDREHHHVDLPAFDGHAGHLRVVAADAESPDAAFAAEPAGMAEDLAVEDAAEILLGVDVVDHPDVEVVGPELLQLGFERRAGLFRIARAEVLALLPDGAEVPLNDEIPAAAFEGGADVFAQLRVRRVDIDEVDAAVDGEVEIRADFSGALLHESLASECYGTHAQARSAQYSVLHIVSVFRWMMTAQRYVEKSDSERPELRILLPILRIPGPFPSFGRLHENARRFGGLRAYCR